MAATLPIKTTAEDVDKLLEYLGSKPGWVDTGSVKSNLGAVGDTRKINTLHYLGVVERDGSNVKLTAAGRTLSRAGGEERTSLFAQRLKATPLYNKTLEWIHWQSLESPTKVDIASQWFESGPGADGEPEGLVTDGVICFFRMAEYGGLGKFITAGGSREARLDIDKSRLAGFVTGQADEQSEVPVPPAGDVGQNAQTGTTVRSPVTHQVSLDPGVRINIEIHIAADATPETIEEIFKNMRQYVLNNPEPGIESG
jgi:hypothetical protein